MSKIRVLVAENSRDFVYLLVQHLSKYAELDIVGVAYDGAQAIEMVQKTRPDVLLLDFIMPCVDGVEVLKKLRQEKTEIKIIVMSAIDINRLVNHVMGLKFDRYFVKPFDFHDLFVAIKEVTGT